MVSFNVSRPAEMPSASSKNACGPTNVWLDPSAISPSLTTSARKGNWSSRCPHDLHGPPQVTTILHKALTTSTLPGALQEEGSSSLETPTILTTYSKALDPSTQCHDSLPEAANQPMLSEPDQWSNLPTPRPGNVENLNENLNYALPQWMLDG